jgi:DNA-binding transcriptional regulator YiaG
MAIQRSELDWDAARVKAVRAKLGLSVADFADKLGVTRMSIYNWEAGLKAMRDAHSIRALLAAEREASSA